MYAQKIFTIKKTMIGGYRSLETSYFMGTLSELQERYDSQKKTVPGIINELNKEMAYVHSNDDVQVEYEIVPNTIPFEMLEQDGVMV